MPNIRFTRGGKWLHQQCKTYRRGSPDTTATAKPIGTTAQNLMDIETSKSGMEFTEEEMIELMRIEAASSKADGVWAIIYAVNIMLNIILFFAGVCCSMSLVVYALISTAATFLILFIQSIISGIMLDKSISKRIEEMKKQGTLKAEYKTNRLIMREINVSHNF